jgi:membrane protein implicated in regulation of membrane protease activity
MRAVAVASWVIYAILGVLVLLIVWRVLREWTYTTDQAANLRTAVFIIGVIIAALVVWHFMPR